MLFQVKRDNKVMFWTKDKDCIPDEEQIKALKRAGYKIKQSKEAKSENQTIMF